MQNRTAGDLIRTYREQEGLTQEELSEIIHVTKGKLAHWESNETIPRPTMVARLIGALRLSEDKAALLKQSVEDAKLQRVQEQAEIQAIIDEQIAEAERLEHQHKALNLLWSGIAGFALGCLLSLLTGSHKDNPWYFTPMLGLLVAGIPFGWNFLTDKSEEPFWEPYDPFNARFNFAIELFCFILKFCGAYLIGFFAFPVVLFYHAYKAGKKGTLYRKVMCAILILVYLFVGIIAFFIADASFPGT